MKSILTLMVLASILMNCGGCDKPSAASTGPISIQLNWLHDPTFAGEYALTKMPGLNCTIREGGPNVFPVAEVTAGRATAAVVGADIFLQAIDKGNGQAGSSIVCFFVDFQRNPVGWVLHPDAAARAGFPEGIRNDAKKMNAWLFSKFEDGTLKPGDKRGTETTSIWIQWKKAHSLSDNVKVEPVGFDTSLVLSAPLLAYPVYLNEEPFKLSEKIGKSVLVFDPAVDGVELCGNVLITTKTFADGHPEDVRRMQRALRDGWEHVKLDRQSAAADVAGLYKGVSTPVLVQQLDKTVEFVFYGGRSAGEMDITEGGKWARTLSALQEAGLVSSALTFDKLREHLMVVPN